MKELLQRAAMGAVDGMMMIIPRPVPDREKLEQCKIISHRGEHDNLTILENTLPAYELARQNGVWGIECDIRWTADLVPVISHDPTAQRVFGKPLRVADVSFEQLRDEIPEIPSLAELIDEFGGNTHLMLEIKAGDWPDEARQKTVLAEHLAQLAPVQDYHLLALDPALFTLVDALPANCLLPVAELNARPLSRAALDNRFAGLAGHYFLLGESLRRRHADAGQVVGSGFPASKNCLFRELNRSVDWIFSNDAVKLQRIVNSYLAR